MFFLCPCVAKTLQLFLWWHRYVDEPSQKLSKRCPSLPNPCIASEWRVLCILPQGHQQMHPAAARSFLSAFWAFCQQNVATVMSGRRLNLNRAALNGAVLVCWQAAPISTAFDSSRGSDQLPPTWLTVWWWNKQVNSRCPAFASCCLSLTCFNKARVLQ